MIIKDVFIKVSSIFIVLTNYLLDANLYIY